jgi:hypothetical protein
MRQRSIHREGSAAARRDAMVASLARRDRAFTPAAARSPAGRETPPFRGSLRTGIKQLALGPIG